MIILLEMAAVVNNRELEFDLLVVVDKFLKIDPTTVDVKIPHLCFWQVKYLEVFHACPFLPEVKFLFLVNMHFLLLTVPGYLQTSKLSLVHHCYCQVVV